METSGLLFVSVFCNIQRKPQFEGKYTKFSKYPMIHNEILWKIELFALNSPFYKQIFKKSLEIPTKKHISAATNPTTPLNDAYYGGTSLFIWVYELRQTTNYIIYTSRAVHLSKPSTFISLIKNSVNLYSRQSKI